MSSTATAAAPREIEPLRSWIGRTETGTDTITPVPVAALSATLDRGDPPPRAGDPLPPLWHWLYFLPLHPASELGEDGHAKRGGFLPPVTLPRRMWAGGRFTFHASLHIGEAIRRTSTIVDITQKQGRSGALVFVCVRHEISGAAGLALTEEQDLVYRAEAGPNEASPAPRPAPENPAWQRRIVPDDVLLFRYSALIFNAHRIHYDRRYATEVEKYPGLVVHGPLIATLLLDLLRRNSSAPLASFRFRAVRPLFDLSPFTVAGRADPLAAALWAADSEGFLAMDAEARFRA
ncbi:MAG: MaoC family dehydratase N-terminal domain-containing protein [Rhodospirillales bacterium]|nr:MaoC family dehydratase N-terminal domain-containing protein [Rhodospirillales bacterium]